MKVDRVLKTNALGERKVVVESKRSVFVFF